jgi:uncharacterized UBP type Zn finger protein
MGQQKFSNAVRRLAFQRSLASRPCSHATELIDAPRSALACPGCERDGSTWVKLRMCLSCGSIGCCDSSTGKHARRHFSETGHPVMRSIEGDEDWAWCYVDRAYLSLRPAQPTTQSTS